MSDSKHPCTCNSGRYCHKHRRYSSKQAKTATHYHEDKSYSEELYNLTQNEQCGGGRRIIRGGISSNNHSW